MISQTNSLYVFVPRRKQFFQKKKKKRIFNVVTPINDPLRLSNQREARWSNDRWTFCFSQRGNGFTLFYQIPIPPPSPPRNETWKYLSRVTRVNRADTFVRINSSCLRERGRRGSAETGREGGRKGMVWSERVEVLKRNELLGYLMYIRDFGFR